MKKLLVFLMMLMATMLVGCRNDEEYDIYTSIYPLQFIVEEIVQDRYTVGSIYPKGKCVHHFEISPKNLIKMSKSQIIIYLGLGLEYFIENLKETSLSGVPMVVAATGLEVVLTNDSELKLHTYDGSHTDIYDSHVWLCPLKMKQLADNVYAGLLEHLELSEDDIEFFQSNLNKLKVELDKLDNEYKAAINSNLYEHKTILVDHDAYVYWTISYGIDRIKIRNHNDDADVVPKDMQQKIELAKSLNIKYIVTTKHEHESSILSLYLKELDLPRSAKIPIHHLGTISVREERAGENYFTIMRDNLRILQDVLPKK